MSWEDAQSSEYCHKQMYSYIVILYDVLVKDYWFSKKSDVNCHAHGKGHLNSLKTTWLNKNSYQNCVAPYLIM